MPETTVAKAKTRNIRINLALIGAIAVLFCGSLLIGQYVSRGQEESFGGTDGAAETVILENSKESNPDKKEFEPWFNSFFKPAGEVESGLFAMQAALGAGVLGFALGWYRCKSKLKQ